MKNNIIRIVLLVAMVVVSVSMMAQALPPDPPTNPGSGGDPIGGAAPVGTGIGILLSLLAAYGAYKLYMLWKARQTPIDE